MPANRSMFSMCLLALALFMTALLASSAAAQTGGAPSPTDPTAPAPVTPAAPATYGVATIGADGAAIPPVDAPLPVKRAIYAGNRIRTLPYRWGGGHAKFRDTGYDCSGAVSFVLKAARTLKRPMASGPLASAWGVPGIGQWITVYANGGHVYVVIAGLRWDTSAVGEPLNSGSGPRWRTTARTPTGYVARHFLGL